MEPSPDLSIAEEIQNAPTVIPLSMGISTLLNGTLGFSMLIALVFCMPSNIQETLNSETYYPFMSIYTFAVGSTSGATAMVSSLLEKFSTTEHAITLNRSYVRRCSVMFLSHLNQIFKIISKIKHKTNERRRVSSPSLKYSPLLAFSQRLHGCYGHLRAKVDFHFPVILQE